MERVGVVEELFVQLSQIKNVWVRNQPKMNHVSSRLATVSVVLDHTKAYITGRSLCWNLETIGNDFTVEYEGTRVTRVN